MTKYTTIIFIVLTLSGCATDRLNRIEKRLNYIENNISRIESGMIKNDKNLKTEINKLYDETEKEIRNIKSKTDKFTVRQNSETLLFEPTYQ